MTCTFSRWSFIGPRFRTFRPVLVTRRDRYTEMFTQGVYALRIDLLIPQCNLKRSQDTKGVTIAFYFSPCFLTPVQRPLTARGPPQACAVRERMSLMNIRAAEHCYVTGSRAQNIYKDCLQRAHSAKPGGPLSVTRHSEGMYFHRRPFLASGRPNCAEKKKKKKDPICVDECAFLEHLLLSTHVERELCKLAFLFNMLPMIHLDLTLFARYLVNKLGFSKRIGFLSAVLSTDPQMSVALIFTSRSD